MSRQLRVSYLISSLITESNLNYVDVNVHACFHSFNTNIHMYLLISCLVLINSWRMITVYKHVCVCI